MDLYWFIRLLFTKEASCRQIIALCQTFSSQYCVGDRRANRKMCVAQLDIWIFLKRVTCTGTWLSCIQVLILRSSCVASALYIYFLLISTLHATKLVAKNLWFLTAWPDTRAGGTDIPGDAAGGNKKQEEREDLLRLEGVRAGRELGQLLLEWENINTEAGHSARLKGYLPEGISPINSSLVLHLWALDLSPKCWR